MYERLESQYFFVDDDNKKIKSRITNFEHTTNKTQARNILFVAKNKMF